MDNKTTLQQLKDFMNKFVKERNWDRYQNIRNISISLVKESAELLKNFQWMNENELEDAEKNSKHKEKFTDELIDILSYVFIAANRLDVDLSKAWEKRFKEIQKKYPAETFSPEKDLSWEEDNKKYYEIKEKESK